MQSQGHVSWAPVASSASSRSSVHLMCKWGILLPQLSWAVKLVLPGGANFNQTAKVERQLPERAPCECQAGRAGSDPSKLSSPVCHHTGRHFLPGMFCMAGFCIQCYAKLSNLAWTFEMLAWCRYGYLIGAYYCKSVRRCLSLGV